MFWRLGFFALFLKHSFWNELFTSALSVSWQLNSPALKLLPTTCLKLYGYLWPQVTLAFLLPSLLLSGDLLHQYPFPLHKTALSAFSWLLKYCLVLVIFIPFSLPLLYLLWGCFLYLQSLKNGYSRFSLILLSFSPQREEIINNCRHHMGEAPCLSCLPLCPQHLVSFCVFCLNK